MPHYKDGTEAKVGDQVIGKLYNTPGIRAGTVISITPGQDSCNAMVAYIEPLLIDGDPADAWTELELNWSPGYLLSGGAVIDRVPRMAVYRPRRLETTLAPVFRVVRGLNHGADGPAFALFECADYCAIAELQRIGP